MSFLSLLQFQAPLWLALFPFGLGLLILAYRLSGKPKVQMVSSLIFLRKLSSAVQVKKRFVPPLLFFIEIALLLLFLLFLSGVHLGTGSAPVAIIIDNSPSALVRTEEGDRAIDVLKKDAVRSIKSYPALTQFEVWRLLPTSQKLHNNPVNAQQAEQLISEINISFTQPNVIDGINNIIQNGNYSQIHIFSDQVNSPLDVSKVVSHPLRTNKASENWRIFDLSISDKVLSFEIEKESKSSSECRLNVSEVARSGELTILKEAKCKVGGNKLQLDRTSEVLQVELVVKDAIDWDNTSWVSQSGSTSEFTIVSTRSKEELGINRITDKTFKIIKKDQLNSSLTGPVILDGYYTDEISSNIFLNLPTSGPFQVNGLASGYPLKIESHNPLLRYLSLRLLKFPKVPTLSMPPGGQPILSLSGGIVIATQDLGSKIVVASGIDLFPFAPAVDRFKSILLLNILQTISEERSVSKGAQEAFYSVSALPDSGNKWNVLEKKPGVLVEGGAVSKVINYYNRSESSLSFKEQLSPNISVPQVQVKDLGVSLEKELQYALLLVLLTVIGFFMYRLIPRS